MKIAIFTFALILTFTTVNSQNLDEYKYIVVPETFAFSDSVNEYQLNALTKFLFEKNNYKVIMKSEKRPSDLEANGCLGLYADVKEDSNLFVTKLMVVLENCNGEIIFRSKEGKSREKDFKRAHHEALREAFTSFEDLEYEYEAQSLDARAQDRITAVPENNGEVMAETPAEDMKAVRNEELEDEEMEVTTKKEDGIENSYVLNNAVYFLEASDSGYSLFQKGMAEPFASLVKSGEGDSFIYASITKQGLAYFDDEGNLVVEHFNRNKNTTVKTIYQIRN
jgi:hypothetical protein